MAMKKKILASEVYVGKAVEAALLSLAEQTKANAEQAKAITQEIHIIAQALMSMAQRTDARFGALEARPAAGG
jgi:hypothetical protein